VTPVQPDWLAPPFSVTDLMAALLGVLAVLHGVLFLRDREPGMNWFALGMACFAVWIGNNERHLPTHPVYASSPAQWVSVLVVGLCCLCVGLTAYLGLQGRARRYVLALLLAPLGVYEFLAVATDPALGGWQLPRNLLNLLAALTFVGLGSVALWAARRERDLGHVAIGLAFFSLPASAVYLLAVQSPSAHLRYWSYLVVMVLGLTLLLVSLRRRHAALLSEVHRRRAAEKRLAELNSSLEAQVEARTSELRDVIDGLETFNRAVSHDLRGPLGGIGGLARLAERALARGDTAAVQRMLAPIADQAEASGRLLEALLTLARSGDAALTLAPVDVAALARAVGTTLTTDAASAAEARATLVVGEVPPALADETLLRAVLTNLIGNALKFSARRADGRVEVSGRIEEGRVVVSVSDNGVGFAPEAAASLFAPFARLHGSAFAGTGIGLTIVRRIVERHGGRVWAEGREGEGARFFFTLPAA
jgi:signal transduction histidine kinase